MKKRVLKFHYDTLHQMIMYSPMASALTSLKDVSEQNRHMYKWYKSQTTALLRTQGDVGAWIRLWVKWRCKMKYQCLIWPARILRNERAQREHKKTCGHSNHVIICFVSLMNGLIVSPSYTQMWEQQAIR